MKLSNQNRTGLLAEHTNVEQGPHERIRLTIPACEALMAAGATIIPTGDGLHTVTLGGTVPTGLVAVSIIGTDHRGLRLDIEPEYPGEFADYWLQVDMTPCADCGAPLVWYEAGYGPGYRVCAKSPHHHFVAK